jgi:hypothetical protein
MKMEDGPAMTKKKIMLIQYNQPTYITQSVNNQHRRQQWYTGVTENT